MTPISVPWVDAMDAEVETLWAEYLKAEGDHVRDARRRALDRFIDRLVEEPSSVWQAWARELASSISDRGADTPVRFPLFRRVLLPALADGVRRGEPSCARWLASFESMLLEARGTTGDLPAEWQTAVGLLTEAVRRDPNDDVARRRLVDQHASYLRYSLHELPTGVLYGQDGATPEQCDELSEVLAQFKEHVAATAQEQRFSELISDCELHFRAYRDYLRSNPRPRGYEEYLRLRGAAT
jgi:hypothetical protein